MDNDELLGMLDDIDALGEGLTDFEVRFVARLIDDNVEEFSPKQAKIIKETYERRVR